MCFILLGCGNLWLVYFAPGKYRSVGFVGTYLLLEGKLSKTKVGWRKQSSCMFLLSSCMAPSRSSRLKHANFREGFVYCFSRGNLSWQCRCVIALQWPILGEFVEERKLFPWHSSQVIGLVGWSNHLYLESRLEKSFTMCLVSAIGALLMFISSFFGTLRGWEQVPETYWFWWDLCKPSFSGLFYWHCFDSEPRIADFLWSYSYWMIGMVTFPYSIRVSKNPPCAITG